MLITAERLKLTPRGSDSTYNFHPTATLDDAPANAEKYWMFQTNSAQINYGLQASYEERTLSAHSPLSHMDFTWALTPTSSNLYISTTVTKLDPGQTYEADKRTDQVLDQYGNVQQVIVYNFAGAGLTGSVARTTTNTFSTNANFISRYIFNRLRTSTVTDGTNTATLVSNSYDGTTISSVTGLYEHDDTDYPATFTYRGNVTSSSTPTTSTTNYYDMAGNVTKTIVNGVTTNVTTNSSSNYAAPNQVTTNALSSTMNWSGFLGLSSVTGPNGDSASINYDSNARPHTTTSPYGAVTTYTYNDNASPPNKIATTNGHWVETVMDGFGRPIQTITGNGATTVSTVDIQYAPCGCSPLGKLSQQSQPYAPGGSDAWTVYHYDASGRTTSTVLPDGASTTSYQYQGNTVTVTDPASKWKTFTNDALGNLVSVLETDPTLGNVTTTYAYDVLNHLTTVTMPRGTHTQTRTFNYTTGTTVGAFLLSATNPENGTVTYTYSNNLLASKTDAKSQNFTYQYDTYNRLASLTWTNPPGGGTQVLRTFMYDTNTLDGTFSGAYTAGRLVAVQNAQFKPGNGATINWIQMVEMYGYTQAGSVSNKRLQVNENVHYLSGSLLYQNLDATYTYDNEGKMKSVNYPTTWAYSGSTYTSTPGATYTYAFDTMSRPITLTDQNSVVDVNGVSYNAANQMLGITAFTRAETRQYNNLGQLTQLNNLHYNYPATTNNGKISSLYNSTSGETVTYTYDTLNRLATAAASGWGEQYGFDGFGNLSSKTPTAGTPPTLSQVSDWATNRGGGSFDANGNQTSAPGTSSTLTYDAENRLIQVFPGAQYSYDSQNKRVWTGVEDYSLNLTSQAVNFYGVDGQLLGTFSFGVNYSGGGAPLNLSDPPLDLRVYFAGKHVVDINQLGQKSTFGQDQLGSNTASNISLYPWGEDRGTPGPNDQVKFATYTRDSATLLDYADQRYYLNNGGRFMSPDPYTASGGPSDPGSWNRYA